MMWTNKPTSDGGRCNLRGVLKITPPKWAQSVSYHMAFENSTLFSFNIGDSLTNNGWGKNNDSWETVLRQCQCLSTMYRKTGGRNSACGGFGVSQQMATHTYRNPQRKHFPPVHQGTPHKDNRPVVKSPQR